MNLRKGDQVLVLAGNDKGKKGKILHQEKDRVLVQGINIRKKHIKRKQQNETSQILEKECPIHRSNVAICDDKENRLKLHVRVQGKKKELVYENKGKIVVYRNLKNTVKS